MNDIEYNTFTTGAHFDKLWFDYWNVIFSLVFWLNENCNFRFGVLVKV